MHAYTVSLSQSELFHLRILLQRVKGAMNWESLRTVNGEAKETFTEACLAHGFIKSDREWTNAMREATVFMMPNQLRSLFVRILIHCNPVNPNELWNILKDAMSEDLNRRYGKNESYSKALVDIQQKFQVEGKSFDDFPQFQQSLIVETTSEVTFIDSIQLNEYLTSEMKS